jgi:2-oxoisovalerate dehydrogenase E2 component (dihydrolipoyl transacylase)
LAAETGIDPSQVVGTGANGRVTRQDMEKAAVAAAEKQLTAAPAVIKKTADDDEILPLTHIRRSIAAHMAESKRTVPHAWTMVEVDVTSLVRFRESIKEDVRKREGVNLTYLPFVIKAAVEGLREYPILNSQWDEEHIVLRKHINIAIAVDLAAGLTVPVIKDADQKSIVGLAHAIHDLATRARAGTLRVDDMQSGTFTINNTGAFGSVMSAPIINYPQAAILSMETIVRRPVVVDEGIAIRDIMNMCVSLDHRVLDGAVIGRFLKSVKKRLESYDATTPIY